MRGEGGGLYIESLSLLFLFSSPRCVGFVPKGSWYDISGT